MPRHPLQAALNTLVALSDGGLAGTLARLAPPLLPVRRRRAPAAAVWQTGMPRKEGGTSLGSSTCLPPTLPPGPDDPPPATVAWGGGQ